jgi:hypothetical protein
MYPDAMENEKDQHFGLIYYASDLVLFSPCQTRFSIASDILLPNKKSPVFLPDFLLSGDYLSSQEPAFQVLLARESLTAVFGMGTGISSPSSSPHI